MIARSTTADVNVIALVGERGREVREFVERDLGDALAHSVVVVATSDQPALVRIQAAFTATAIAEHFRDQGKNVMLMMDSVTRFAMAQREVGLAIGEPPATRGYTPSVFALLPRLLERAGTSPERLDHRPLHRARRRRRHERADRRCGPVDPRRPHRAHALARALRPLPGDRRAAERQPARRRDRRPRDPRGRHPAALGAGRLPREGRPHLDRRLPARHRPAAGRGDRAAPGDGRLPAPEHRGPAPRPRMPTTRCCRWPRSCPAPASSRPRWTWRWLSRPPFPRLRSRWARPLAPPPPSRRWPSL